MRVGRAVAPRLHIPRIPPRSPRRTGPLRIAAVGRLTHQKGFDVLIDATRRCMATGCEVQVAIAGDGRDRLALEATAVGLPVRFVGYLPDITGHLGWADLFCLPSRAEGLPLALLEAMGAGIPCIASAVGDIPVVLGGSVVIVPPQDDAALAAAVMDLAAAPIARRRLARSAAELVGRRFTAERMVADTEVHLVTAMRRHQPEGDQGAHAAVEHLSP